MSTAVGPGSVDRTSRSRLSRARARAIALRDDAERRAEHERERHASVAAVFDIVDRDGEVGGGIIAAALAYRLFIWMLPLALVVVAGLGLAAEASGSPRHEAARLGLGGLVSSSVAGAAKSPNRWYALLVGIPVLFWATRSVLRVLIGAHRLVWGEPRRSVPKPTLGATLKLLGLVLALLLVSAGTSALRHSSTAPGLVGTLLVALPYAALWLLVTLQLPHAGARWTALLPGALLFGIGIEVLNLVIAYVITPWALTKQGTYGALGLAAAILVGLYLISRLAVEAAVVSATLWRRKQTAG